MLIFSGASKTATGLAALPLRKRGKSEINTWKRERKAGSPLRINCLLTALAFMAARPERGTKRLLRLAPVINGGADGVPRRM